MNEQLLISGIYNGNEAAYKSLFYTYFEPLTYFANKYLNDMELSRDVVQDVFSMLFEKRESLHIEESLKSFLYKSVSNRCLNSLKRDEMKGRHHKIIKLQSDESFFEDFLETSELQAKINRLMETLPPECKKVFKMSRMDQKSNQEIADELNISKRTVETHISKALKVFKTALKIIILELFLKYF